MELLLELENRYTYANYMTWWDDKRRELINGFIRMMSAPNTRHQQINRNLLTELYLIVKKNKGKCEVFPAPFDVRLPHNGEKEHKRIYTVVQPDICIVCDLSKLDEEGCLGAPDFVAEVQSEITAKYDMNSKLKLYEEAGVREYWVVFPPNESVLQFILQPDGKYDWGKHYETGEVPIHIFGGLTVDLKDVF